MVKVLIILFLTLSTINLESSDDVKIIEFEKESDFRHYIKSTKEVMVLYYKNDCPPCDEVLKTLSIVYKKISTSYPFLRFVKINIFNNP